MVFFFNEREKVKIIKYSLHLIHQYLKKLIKKFELLYSYKESKRTHPSLPREIPFIKIKK